VNKYKKKLASTTQTYTVEKSLILKPEKNR